MPSPGHHTLTGAHIHLHTLIIILNIIKNCLWIFFATINSQHYKYGASANFKLPAGIGLSTDFFFYKRVGYGVKELDTTDKVWNMRLTYTPKGGHWVFAADGFDLLHKLSNVHYAVTASGRTVSYTNSLPRYFMFTVQYRLNIQPRK